jgi:hypothetical protein
VRGFFALHSNQTDFGAHGASFPVLHSLDINRPGCEVRHSPLSGAEIQEIWSYIYIQTPGNYPEENIQHTEHGESLESRMLNSYLAQCRYFSAGGRLPFPSVSVLRTPHATCICVLQGTVSKT